MKKIVVILVCICFMFTLTGCGDTKVIDGIEYDTYGFINKEEKRNPNIKYELIIGNIVWGAILVETIVAPIYFFGFSLYEPVGKKVPGEPIGAV